MRNLDDLVPATFLVGKLSSSRYYILSISLKFRLVFRCTAYRGERSGIGLFKIEVYVQVDFIQEGSRAWSSLKFRFVFRYTAHRGETSGIGLFKIQVYVQVDFIQEGSRAWSSLKFRFMFRCTSYERVKSGMELFKIQVYVQVHSTQREKVVLFSSSVIILRYEIFPRSNALIQLR